MALLRFNSNPIYASAGKVQKPLTLMALMIAHWLIRSSATLDDKGSCFEAATAEELASHFSAFAREGVEDPEGFVNLWNDLMEWGCTSVTTTTGREQSLCDIPPLSDRYSC